ncbi:protein TRANSPARENT TESTA GLABRA, putative [Entamoeba invadens IP1]|uniref:Protein TRANSPARENT TESTA GLABRA, putative n=1 Tax=Entamoeba invadens IP1 TaxID=370355 RepID=A0A0A1U595_ENTIV|nr:protein TRANSPARENT TESTA GLABRA, putative [Entamoeba invadens IP1]ELP89480.1 protein TRANSPARENT TESTA GLABRA, putative [Entamoeba invadens IP1]|eukprot:XP_004256251.1 protein TRANSPARENT TESTA GLABRA, putative [Entamoeba invadens IP1]
MRVVNPKQNHVSFTSPSLVINAIWSNNPQNPFRSIFSTFSDTYTSHLHLIDFNTQTQTLTKIASVAPADLPFTPTSIHFTPKPTQCTDTFMVSGDALKLFSISRTNDILLLSTFNSQFNEFPSCGLDWSKVNPDLVATWYLNNTTSVWSVEQNKQICAFHQHFAINDMRYSPDSPDVFLLACNSGTLQINDIRFNKPATLLEIKEQEDLMQVKWSYCDSTKIATFSDVGDRIYIHDMRKPKEAFTHLKIQDNVVNSIEWSSKSADQLCIATARDKVLIWNINPGNNVLSDFTSQGEVNDVSWSNVNLEWICTCIESTVHYLHI